MKVVSIISDKVSCTNITKTDINAAKQILLLLLKKIYINYHDSYFHSLGIQIYNNNNNNNSNNNSKIIIIMSIIIMILIIMILIIMILIIMILIIIILIIMILIIMILVIMINYYYKGRDYPVT